MENAEYTMKRTVELYIYDLSRGFASAISSVSLGANIKGIWHTAIVVYGKEYSFNQSGIQYVRPGGTDLGAPNQIKKLGETDLPYSVFLKFIYSLGTTTFAGENYNLFTHNCNTFTNQVSKFLVGEGIPKYILDQPKEVCKTPIRQEIQRLIEGLGSKTNKAYLVGPTTLDAGYSRERSPEFEILNEAIERARLNSIALEERRREINDKLAKKDRKKKKKKKEKKPKGSKDSSASDTNSTGPSNCSHMAESESAISMSEMQASNGCGALLPWDRVTQMEEEEKKEQEEKKRHRDPPIVFKDMMDVKEEYQALTKLLEGKLNEEERVCIDELRQYVLENEGSWALGDNFLNFVGRILYDKSLESDARVKLLNILSVAALKDDVILLLHQDRREHIIMNYAYQIESHPPEERLALAQFLANMFENLSSSEWLLYISEWQYNKRSISNIIVTTKVAVHSLLSTDLDMQIRGAAIIHNLACKEIKTVVFDEVVVELIMALLQYFNGNPEEEQLHACMKSLARFTQISGQDITQIIQEFGPDPNKFRGTSKRIDEQIDQINQKLRLTQH